MAETARVQLGAHPPVPVLQVRQMDGADLLVALPRSTSFETDQGWLAAVIRLLRPLPWPSASWGDVKQYLQQFLWCVAHEVVAAGQRVRCP
jgi:hypothetical protein